MYEAVSNFHGNVPSTYMRSFPLPMRCILGRRPGWKHSQQHGDIEEYLVYPNGVHSHSSEQTTPLSRVEKKVQMLELDAPLGFIECESHLQPMAKSRAVSLSSYEDR